MVGGSWIDETVDELIEMGLAAIHADSSGCVKMVSSGVVEELLYDKPSTPLEVGRTTACVAGNGVPDAYQRQPHIVGILMTSSFDRTVDMEPEHTADPTDP